LQVDLDRMALKGWPTKIPKLTVEDESVSSMKLGKGNLYLKI